MNDFELESHIADCGRLMEQSHAQWEATGGFEFKGEADGWLVRMEAAIKARSPQQVARMEAARGLSA